MKKRNVPSSSLGVIIDQLAHRRGPWGIKDAQSRHLYMNKAALLYTGTPSSFSLEGRSDGDFPAAWAECEDDLIEHDRRTLATSSRVAVIETHYWNGLAELQPYISEKIPLYGNGGEFIGVAWNARPLDTQSPLSYIDKRRPSVMSTEASSTLFTRKELDTLFLLLQRFSTKEIARMYGVSHRTVEHHIAALYQKAGVHSLRQFEEYCRQAGLDSYIPPRLLEKGIQFI